MSWKWNTEPLYWRDKCSMCEQPLRAKQDSGIVSWTDSKQYHTCGPQKFNAGLWSG